MRLVARKVRVPDFTTFENCITFAQIVDGENNDSISSEKILLNTSHTVFFLSYLETKVVF